ncbi:MAG: hypothetical protein LBC18_10970 [Opitutaceae bacterium]|jgi:hypothetical protein|nr:hypothetical protein [Opitutaceae bacterium]
MPRLILEISLKPFFDPSDGATRAVCGEILRQWMPLIHDASSVAFLLWAADGSEILDYTGRMEDRFEWAKWIGVGSEPAPGKSAVGNLRHDAVCLHTRHWPYRENPPEMTYGRLAAVVRTLKEETRRLTGREAAVGAPFDPGPEFAESSFKYKRHREICSGNAMGGGQWVNCAARLKGDSRAYAGFPDGIPDGLSLGRFLGRQSQRFLGDLGFDYIWFSNGFGYALEAWSVTGEIFNGREFNTKAVGEVRKSILGFWSDFREECPHFPIEARGSNLSTGMDLSSHGSPVREIYNGGFNTIAPPNSPWAAINGDYGLELVGWMSHIAELPPGGAFPFRFYINDPWWLNSPWLDRYGREPHDIYLPLSVARVNADATISGPASLAMLTVDDSFGRMPGEIPPEVMSHLRRALADFPDEPGLLTWIYPFAEYHEWTFGTPARINEVFFGDWFMRSAINQGFPLNTVVSTEGFLDARATRPGFFDKTILVCPAPDAGSRLHEALYQHIMHGGRAILYGPLEHADPRLLDLLQVECVAPLSGDLTIGTSLPRDLLREGAFPRAIKIREHLSGGGAGNRLKPGATDESELLATVGDGAGQRAFAVARKINGEPRLAWVRGALCEEVTDQQLPRKDDPARWFSAERLMRWVLAHFGTSFLFEKPTLPTPDPLILTARCRNALYFSGFTPSTNTRLHWRLPEGIPVPTGCDVLVGGGHGTLTLPRVWHRECRVFIEQDAPGEVSCREFISGQIGVTRRLLVRGLVKATLAFLADTTAPSRRPQIQKHDADTYPGFGVPYACEETAPGLWRATGVTGEALISW